MTRLQATVALLQAWLDYFPWPETWTGELQRRSTKAGRAPFKRITCHECEGRGKTRSGWMCSTCKGKGYYFEDSYTLEPVPAFELESLAEWKSSFRELLQRFVNCSVCAGWGRLSADSNVRPSNAHPFCDECNGTGRVPAPFTGVFRVDRETTHVDRHEDRQLDALQRGHEQRDDVSLYRDHLLPALHALKRIDRYGHLLVEWVWIMGAQSPESLPELGRVRLVRATRLIEGVLPDPLKLPSEIRAQVAHREASLVAAKGKTADKYARARRDEEIRRRHARGGITLEQLGREFGLDKSQVSRIVTKKVA